MNGELKSGAFKIIAGMLMRRMPAMVE